ncbi:Nif3-like dinuclear metal center hexameric protein [Gordonia westfalica]|uniref:GTP cyclohydrolase 1 type 2 homolog n=1 Tax=Gordonia westfalica TaxID=158898 RepID=A0ABU2GW67_9ACTN|nr:Nif3-like dinuclear metal center hexameric protein [Gordonia westfalica]MDS1115655.1 Nif3-like dinuclear metal center hexameric protein [Gordonia westfalica]
MGTVSTPERVTVGGVVDVVERAYPPALAESWDAVGLVCGDRAEPVRRVLACVDVTDAVVDAAVAARADMVIAHHPLLMRGVTSVAADTPKGRIVHRLIRNGIALLSAHTNADSARPGVSDALADLLGVVDTAPIEPKSAAPLDKWVVMVPEGNVEQVSEAMFAAGAGAIGDYRDCSWTVVGTGQFEAREDATPTIGEIGTRTHVDEARVEMVAARSIRGSVLAALRNAHPYEEPAFDVFELADLGSGLGLGRVGSLVEPMTLRDFTAVAARALRAPSGIRAAGDPDALVRTVAVCGGAGDSLLGRVRGLGVDVYVTGDLRHHPADESLRDGGPALVDAGHWATEFPWCAQVAQLLRDELDVAVTVFDTPTDPFGLHSFG